MAARFDPTVTAPEATGAAAAAAGGGGAGGATIHHFGATAPAAASTINGPMDILRIAMQYVTDLKTYLIRNAWSIVFLLAGGYMIKSWLFDPWYAEYKRKSSYREATAPARVAVLEADMRRVRAAQQEVAEQRAREAEEEARRQKLEAMEKKKVIQPMEDKGGQGRRLGREGDEEGLRRRRRNDGDQSGGGVDRSSGYNAMNPSSGNSTRYSAARRTTYRG